MNFLKYFVTLLYILLLLGCASKKDPILELFDELGDTTKPKYYLVISLKGCSSCVNNAFSFMRKNLSNDKITFVLTTNESKFMNLILDAEEKNSNYILKDRSGHLEKAAMGSNAVLLLEQENGEFISKKSIMAAELDAELNYISEQIH